MRTSLYCTITDQDGNVVAQGTVYKYATHYSANGTSWSVEMDSEEIKASTSDKGSYYPTADDFKYPYEVEEVICAHDWDLYYGLLGHQDYCTKCGEPK